MLKKLNIIHLILLIIDLLITVIISLINGFNSPITFVTVLCALLFGHPLIYLIMMLFKESLILEYDTPKYMPLCMALTILLGCLIWYMFYNVDHVFTQTIGLWYGSILLAFSIPVFIVRIVEKLKKDKKDNNSPKFIKK